MGQTVGQGEIRPTGRPLPEGGQHCLGKRLTPPGREGIIIIIGIKTGEKQGGLARELPTEAQKEFRKQLKTLS